MKRAEHPHIFYEGGLWKCRLKRFTCVGRSPVQAYNNLRYWAQQEWPTTRDEHKLYGFNGFSGTEGVE